MFEQDDANPRTASDSAAQLRRRRVRGRTENIWSIMRSTTGRTYVLTVVSEHLLGCVIDAYAFYCILLVLSCIIS